jgi:hypothetical protein
MILLFLPPGGITRRTEPPLPAALFFPCCAARADLIGPNNSSSDGTRPGCPASRKRSLMAISPASNRLTTRGAPAEDSVKMGRMRVTGQMRGNVAAGATEWLTGLRRLWRRPLTLLGRSTNAWETRGYRGPSSRPLSNELFRCPVFRVHEYDVLWIAARRVDREKHNGPLEDVG